MKLIDKKIAIIGGARPNFMKMAPLYRAFKKRKLNFITINSGQHFSDNMAKQFLDEFEMSIDYNINPRHDSLGLQLADIFSGLKKILLKEKIELLIVFGDVNATLISAMVAKELNIKIAHVEAGLRSFNDKMPEEKNRILTDQISDYLLAPSEDAVKNLEAEKVSGQVILVGNIMIDNVHHFLPKIEESDEKFYFCTLHRPENVDNKENILAILEALEHIAQYQKIYLPLHPRTSKNMETFGLTNLLDKIFHILDPLNYKQSLYYQKNALLVLTDSGGVQEESSIFGTPCLTLRDDTERPITVTHGTNIVAGTSKEGIINAYNSISLVKKRVDIPLWDGQTAARIIQFLQEYD